MGAGVGVSAGGIGVAVGSSGSGVGDPAEGGWVGSTGSSSVGLSVGCGALFGTYSFCPIARLTGSSRQLAALSAWPLTPNRRPIRLKVSPGMMK